MAYQVPVLGQVAGTDEPPAISNEEPPRPTDDQRFVLPRATRYAVVVYLAVLVPLGVALFWRPLEPHAYLRAMLELNIAFIIPTAALAGYAALRSPAKDRVVRWLWTVVIVMILLVLFRTYGRVGPGMDPSLLRALGPIVVALAVLLVANTIMLRNRSGERAAMVDGVDLVMATLALAVPLTLAFGEAILNAPAPWFTITAGLWAVLAWHGTLVALVIRTRIHPDHRLAANLGIGFGATGIVSSVGQVVLGVNGFTMPAGPFIGLFAVSMAAGVLFFTFATREPSLGLERLPVAGQVRRGSLIAVLVLVSIPVTGAVVWWQRDVSWVSTAAIIAGLGLLGLSSVRHLLAAREAMHLHELVERSASERGQLLSEVMSHIDLDRHRAATHLHRQAASLYTAMASFTSAIDQAAESGNSTAVGYAADRLRRDLGQRADGFRRVAEAIKPLAPGEHEARRLAVPMRAYLENLCGDGPRPDMRVDIDPELTLDWTTEAVVLRIAQEATLSALWYAHASTVHISVSADESWIRLEVTDDGTGRPPHRELSAMQSVARFIGGDVVSVSEPSAGRMLVATIPFAVRAASEPARPTLRLVEDA